MVPSDFSVTKVTAELALVFFFLPTFVTFCVCRCSPQTPLPAHRPFRPASILRAQRGLVSRMTLSWWTLCVVRLSYRLAAVLTFA